MPTVPCHSLHWLELLGKEIKVLRSIKLPPFKIPKSSEDLRIFVKFSVLYSAMQKNSPEVFLFLPVLLPFNEIMSSIKIYFPKKRTFSWVECFPVLFNI